MISMLICPRCGNRLSNGAKSRFGQNCICDVCKDLVIPIIKDDDCQCFGYYNSGSRACRYCDCRESCIDEFNKRLPCFGQLTGVGCNKCIYLVRCLEKFEEENVAKDYSKMETKELKELCDELELDNSGSRANLIVRLIKYDMTHQVESEIEEIEDEPEVEKVEPVIDESVDDSVDNCVVEKVEPIEKEVYTKQEVMQAFDIALTAFAAALNVGFTKKTASPQELVDTRVEYETKGADETVKLSGRDWIEETHTEKYLKFHEVDSGTGKPWSEMSQDEKVDFANELEVDYKDTGNARATAIQLAKAVMKHFKIEKYKPEYKSRKARNAIKA